MKKAVSLFLALSLCILLGSAAFAIVGPSDSFYVADYAQVLSEETEQSVIRQNAELEARCSGAQIVVVTVDYLDGLYCDEYAYQLFNDWGVGSAEQNNGMLLLLAVQENKAWLAFGLGLSEHFSSETADELLDRYFWDDFDRGDYDSAVTRLLNALLRWYGETYDCGLSQESLPQSSLRSFLPRLLRILILFAILLALFGSNESGGGRRLGAWLPWLFLLKAFSRTGRNGFRPGGFCGGGGFSGGGMGHGGGGFSGGGGGRR